MTREKAQPGTVNRGQSQRRTVTDQPERDGVDTPSGCRGFARLLARFLRLFLRGRGLGQQLDTSMKMFNGGEVATMLLVFMALVALADRVSAGLRRALG